jgi:hypothetical protein
MKWLAIGLLGLGLGMFVLWLLSGELLLNQMRFWIAAICVTFGAMLLRATLD